MQVIAQIAMHLDLEPELFQKLCTYLLWKICWVLNFHRCNIKMCMVSTDFSVSLLRLFASAFKTETENIYLFLCLLIVRRVYLTICIRTHITRSIASLCLHLLYTDCRNKSQQITASNCCTWGHVTRNDTKLSPKFPSLTHT